MTEVETATPTNAELSTDLIADVQLWSHDTAKVGNGEPHLTTKDQFEMRAVEEGDIETEKLDELQERPRAEDDPQGVEGIAAAVLRNEKSEETTETSDTTDIKEDADHDTSSISYKLTEIKAQASGVAQDHQEIEEDADAIRDVAQQNSKDGSIAAQPELLATEDSTEHHGRAEAPVVASLTAASDAVLFSGSAHPQTTDGEPEGNDNKPLHNAEAVFESDAANSVPTDIPGLDTAASQIEPGETPEFELEETTSASVSETSTSLEPTPNPAANAAVEGGSDHIGDIGEQARLENILPPSSEDVVHSAAEAAAEADSASDDTEGKDEPQKEEDDVGPESEDTVSRASRLESELESLDTIPSEIPMTPSEEQPSLSELESIKTEAGDLTSESPVASSETGELLTDSTLPDLVAINEDTLEELQDGMQPIKSTVSDAEQSVKELGTGEATELAADSAYTITPAAQDESGTNYEPLLAVPVEALAEQMNSSAVTETLDHADIAAEGALQPDDLRQSQLDPNDHLDDSISDDPADASAPVAGHDSAELDPVGESVTTDTAEIEANGISKKSYLETTQVEAAGDLSSLHAPTTEEDPKAHIQLDKTPDTNAEVSHEQAEETNLEEPTEEPAVPETEAKDLSEAQSIESSHALMTEESGEDNSPSAPIHASTDLQDNVAAEETQDRAESNSIDAVKEPDNEIAVQSKPTGEGIEEPGEHKPGAAMDDIAAEQSTAEYSTNKKDVQTDVIERQESAGATDTDVNEEDTLTSVDDAVMTDETVPRVDVEVATPGQEINPMDEDSDMDPDSPLEQRIAIAIGIPAELMASLPGTVRDAAATPGNSVPDFDGETTPSAQQEDIVILADSDKDRQELEQRAEDESEQLEGTNSLHSAEPMSEDVPAKLEVDTNVAIEQDRPKSPWTPSYSVTLQGPGIQNEDSVQVSKPEEAEPMEGDEAIDPPHDSNTSATLSIETEDISHSPVERPKSPFPPSYSVTRSGSDVLEQESDSAPEQIVEPAKSEDANSETTGNLLALRLGQLEAVSDVSIAGSEESLGLESASHIPEAASSPRSELSALTPFDSRSEVSEASHAPIPPSTPRSEPDTLSPVDNDSATPLIASTVLISDAQSLSPKGGVAPERTPLATASEISSHPEEMMVSEVHEWVLPSPAVDFAIQDDKSHDENTTHSSELSGPVVPPVIPTNEGRQDDGKESSVALSQNIGGRSSFADVPKDQVVVSKVDLPVADVIEQSGTEGHAVTSAPVSSIHEAEIQLPVETQPIAVMTTFSKDSAYTQATDETFASDQTEDTRATTPDVEILVMPKLDTSAPAEEERSTDVFDEEAIEEVPAGPANAGKTASKTPNRLSGSVTTVGIGNNFANTFSQVFPSNNSPTDEQAVSIEDVLDDANLDTPAPRRRLHSTVSSLHFPGGWVTSSKSDRPSLEVATGEFSRPQSEDVSASAAAVLSPSQEDRKPDSDKWRCIIM